MPGAIQVTVLEFKGISSPSKPSAKTLKVSMGRREFQTSDKGEFSFPIAKLSQDLIVALLDAAGNEIACSEIRTMHIIEKGSWDEVFSINGCGHVHMKLQFVLSEEERNRIRIMRESVVKKKLETNPNIVNLWPSETSSDSAETEKQIEQISDSERGSEEISVLTPKVESFRSGFYSDATTNREEEGINLDAAIPDTTDGGRITPLSPGNKEIKPESARLYKIEPQPPAGAGSITEEADTSKLLESDDSVNSKSKGDLMQESRRTKVPSNVRKMISAFESSQIQDTGRTDSNQETKSLKKTPSVQSQFNRSRKESLLEDQEGGVSSAVDHTRQSARIVSSSTKPPQVSTVTPVGKGFRKLNLEELQKSPTDLTAKSPSDAATNIGRKVERQPRMARSYGESSYSGSKSLECYEEGCASAQSSGVWIFPDDTRRLCITTAGEHITKIAGNCCCEAKTCQEREISSESEVQVKNVMHGTDKIEKIQQETAHLSRSGVSPSPDDSPNGLIGKAIKVTAILSFGLLVLLTRQKEPRKKKNTEEFSNLFPILNYIDE